MPPVHDLADRLFALDPRAPLRIANLGLPADITYEAALRLQQAVARRRGAAGDPLAGRNAMLSTHAAQAAFPDAGGPIIGAFPTSLLRRSGASLSAPSGVVLVETEIGVRLGGDLGGPDLTPAQVRAAVAAYVPAIDVVFSPLGRPGADYSWAQVTAVQKFVGAVVLGDDRPAGALTDIDADHGVLVVDGREVAAGRAVDLVGGPLQVICAMARQLHTVGERLRAGEIVITGALGKPYVLQPSDKTAIARFHGIGEVEVRFERPRSQEEH